MVEHLETDRQTDRQRKKNRNLISFWSLLFILVPLSWHFFFVFCCCCFFFSFFWQTNVILCLISFVTPSWDIVKSKIFKLEMSSSIKDWKIFVVSSCQVLVLKEYEKIEPQKRTNLVNKTAIFLRIKLSVLRENSRMFCFYFILFCFVGFFSFVCCCFLGVFLLVLFLLFFFSIEILMILATRIWFSLTTITLCYCAKTLKKLKSLQRMSIYSSYNPLFLNMHFCLIFHVNKFLLFKDLYIFSSFEAWILLESISRAGIILLAFFIEI